jgi:perosamine synthetase
MNERIHYTKPSISELEISYANDAVTNGWGPRCYEYIDRFEESFKRHLGVSYAIATSSATGALHMGMSALGIGSGDEVILADINWIASVAPVIHLGASPVLVDIDETSWCLSFEAVKAAITPKTKAIMAVHLYGNVCEMDELIKLCDEAGIFLIEDAAEAIGSEYKGKKAGSMGIFGAFSFHGTKTITTGEGGMFVTNDKDVYERVLTLSNHGRSKLQTKQFWPDMIGFKYKMSNVQAAIGLAQIERIDELVDRKREVFGFYKKELKDLKGVSLNPELSDRKSGYWMVNVVFSEKLGITRDLMIEKFSDHNIDARVFFWPLSDLDFIESRTNNSVAKSLPSRSVNIPCFHDITKQEQLRIIDIIKETHEQNSRAQIC